VLWEAGVTWTELGQSVKAFNVACALPAADDWPISMDDIAALAPGKMTTDGAVNFYMTLLRMYYTPHAVPATSDPLVYFSSTHVFSANFNPRGATQTTTAQMHNLQRIIGKRCPRMLQASFWVLPIYYELHFSLAMVVHPGARMEVSETREVTFHPPVMYHLDSINGYHPSASIFEWVRTALVKHDDLANALAAQQQPNMDPLLKELMAARSAAIGKMTRCELLPIKAALTLQFSLTVRLLITRTHSTMNIYCMAG
jgi:hypothetical protein